MKVSFPWFVFKKQFQSAPFFFCSSLRTWRREHLPDVFSVFKLLFKVAFMYIYFFKLTNKHQINPFPSGMMFAYLSRLKPFLPLDFSKCIWLFILRAKGWTFDYFLHGLTTCVDVKFSGPTGKPGREHIKIIEGKGHRVVPG